MKKIWLEKKESEAIVAERDWGVGWLENEEMNKRRTNHSNNERQLVWDTECF